MNVYDFDHTIYAGDCTLDFWFWCIRKNAKVFKAFPKAVMSAIQFRLGKKSREEFKEAFYQFLRYVSNPEKEVELFWDSHIDRVEQWYLEQQKRDDLVISASPEFLVFPACERLGIYCIASKVDIHTGQLLGNNCRGEEKVRRLMQEHPHTVIERFYSDSLSDKPLSKIAQQSYLICGRKRIVWED